MSDLYGVYYLRPLIESNINWDAPGLLGKSNEVDNQVFDAVKQPMFDVLYYFDKGMNPEEVQVRPHKQPHAWKKKEKKGKVTMTNNVSTWRPRR